MSVHLVSERTTFMPSDGDLLHRFAREKDQEAFRELVARHVDMVYGVARRVLGTSHADDVVQAVFLLLSQRADSVSRQRSLVGWLFRVAMYCCANIKKSEDRRRRRERESAMERKEDFATNEELAAVLDEALGRLGEKERQAILVRYMERKSVAETSEILGVSVSVVEKRLKRGIERIRGVFARKGFVVPVAVVGTVMMAESAKAAPVCLAVSAGGVTIQASASVIGIAKGALAMMKMVVVKTIATVVAATVIVGSVVWCIPASAEHVPERVSPALVPVAAETLPERFSFVAKQIEQALSQVKSVSYRASMEAQDLLGELGRRHITCDWDIIEKGPLRAGTRNSSMTFANGRTPGQKYTTRAVLGTSYFAMRLNENRIADQYVYESLADMSEKAGGQVRSYAGISIMAYGFGDGDIPFSSPYLHNPAISRWEVTEIAGEGGASVYHLKRYVVADPTRTHHESLWVVDPKQGWLITQLMRYDADGRVWSDLKVKGAEVAKGIFLAASVEYATYAGKMSPEEATAIGLKSPDEHVNKRTITFTDVAVNPDLPDERFTLAYLGLPDGSMIQQHQANGTVKAMGSVDNQVLEPAAVAEFMMRKRRLAEDAASKTPKDSEKD